MDENYTNKQPLNFNINMSVDNNTNMSSTMQNSNNNNQQYIQNGQRDSIDFTNFLQHAANPGIVLFTLLFKTLAVLSFLLLGIFGVSDALIFIIVVILNAFDFWFVKNVSGRILVGLRWWNEVRDDGTEVWIFESDHEKRATSIDTTLFWTSLYITPCFWGVFLVIELIGLSLVWFLVCLISFVLTFSNTVGYYKCSGEQNKKIANFLAEKGQQGFTTFLKFGANAMTNNQQGGNK